jgi:hypothetical protein
LEFRVIFFAAYLFLGSLLPSSDLHELSKISYLLQHYQTHKALTSELGFDEFLDMHYLGAEDTSSEHHDRLPLKQMGNSAYDFFVALPLLQPVFRVQAMPGSPQYATHTQPRVPEAFTGNLWQPPQLG